MRKVAGLALLASTLFLSACSKASQDEALRIGFPEPVTAEGVTILNLWQGTWIVAIGVAVLVLGLLFAALVLYRRRSDADVPKQTRGIRSTRTDREVCLIRSSYRRKGPKCKTQKGEE